MSGFGYNFFLCFFIANYCFGQINFIQNNDIGVVKNGDNLDSPWAGGLNFAQFSKLDLNLDGVDDLLVFDRSGKNGTKNGNKIIPFLYNQDINNYKYAPEYIESFPSLKDWALMVDYNLDNKVDIFTSSDNSIAVYTNTSNDFLEFDFYKMITSDAGFGQINVYVNSADIPAIVDIDGDSDIDILSFDPSGSYIYLHENKSTELYNNADSIELTRSDNCWGRFREDFSTNSVTLNLNDDCIYDSESMRMGHSGSTVLALDLDPLNNQGFELLLGDITYNNMVMLFNGEDNNSNLMYSQDLNFPSYDQSIDITRFPGAFHIDIDNDNLKDLIISPNGVNVSENHKNCLFYKNTGLNENNYYEFEFVENDFLIKEMIDVGTNSHPTLIDLNDDNLLDLIISNKGYFDNGNYNSRISLYKNIGTINQPTFELITEDFNNISEIGNLANIQSLYPTFGDLNNDGQVDMIIGDNNGQIYYFENNIDSTSEWPSYEEYVVLNIDVGSFATPQLIDLNRDNLLDLVIGERMGVDNGILNGINYFQNTGTMNEAVFEDFTPEFIDQDGTIIKSLGAIHLADATYLTGYTAPHIFEIDGLYYLAVGTENGNIYLYDNIETEMNENMILNINNEFNLISENMLNINNCIHSKVSIADVDSDNQLDLIRGNANGGLEFFKGDANNFVNENDINQIQIKIKPNPNQGSFKIQLNNNNTKYITLFSTEGQILYKQKTNLNLIEINNFKSGVYIIKIELDDKTLVEKIIVTK